MKKLNLLICLSLFAVACTENVSDVIRRKHINTVNISELKVKYP
jgi:hypothetical protein